MLICNFHMYALNTSVHSEVNGHAVVSMNVPC